MHNILNQDNIKIYLDSNIHDRAYELAMLQSEVEKAASVYANVIAVSAIMTYLNWFGIDSDLDACESLNPILATVGDIADLYLPGIGSLECRILSPGAKTINLTKNKVEDRIGCVILSCTDLTNIEELENATDIEIIGFTQDMSSVIQIENLIGTEKLINFLENIKLSGQNIKPQAQEEIISEEIKTNNEYTHPEIFSNHRQSNKIINFLKYIFQEIGGLFNEASEDWEYDEATTLSNNQSDNLLDINKSSCGVFELVLVQPINFNEMPQIIDVIRQKKGAILNTISMDEEEAQRAVDFIAGATYAIDGHYERISDNLFLFTPNRVSIAKETSLSCSRLKIDKLHIKLNSNQNSIEQKTISLPPAFDRQLA